MSESVVRSAKQFQDEEQRLQGAQRWDELVRLYESRAQAVDDDAQRERMLYRAGEVSLDQLTRPEQAEGFFQRAFEVRRTFLPALGALKALHSKAKNRAGVQKVLGYELEVTKEPRRLGQLHHELGKLLRDDKKTDAAIAEPVGSTPASGGPRPGQGGTQTFTFKASGAGTTTITLTYARSFAPEDNPTVQEYTLVVSG